MNLPPIQTRVWEYFSWEKSSVEGVLTDFPTPILPKIGGEPKIEGLIHLHRLISGNVASMASNLGVGWHGHLALTITA